MKKHLKVFFIIVSLCAFVVQSKAQSHKYPATINPILGLPYTSFLSDYSTPGGNVLNATIVFNDFNEPSWNFRLRMKIESSNIRMETVHGYKPQAPVTLVPGVAKTLSGIDWEEYFDYNNFAIGGTSVSQLVSSGGKLPEGLYSFCFQVLDYETGDPLSEEVCRSVWLKLIDPPRLNLPLCGNRMDPTVTQHPFAWQSFDTSSPNATQGSNYQLTIWEATDRGVNPQTAVVNGQALQIFQSSVLTQPTYAYGLADPPLELGKQYVYRVQAIDPLGRDKYKNQGYSEFCSFYFGWPINGNISLQFPEEGGGFRKRDIPYVKWSAVDTQLPGQPVSYEIRVAPIGESQTIEQSISSNDPWYYNNTPPTPTTYDRSQQMNEKLETMTKYSWQVKAFTNQQEIGKSKVSYFNGPSLLEEFWANVHRVVVDYLDGANLNDLSGAGRVRFTAESNAWVSVKFEHIQLKNMGDFYLMVGGEFFYEPPNLSILLTAAVDQNGAANFDVTRFRVNKDGIYAEGNVKWLFPFATMSSGISFIKTDIQWANYNNFTINAAARVAKGNQFKLLEPLNLVLNLSQSGLIYINNNEYRFILNGQLELPDNIKGANPGIVKLPFTKADQLYYIEQDSIGSNHIAPLAKANVKLTASKYILDLSEEKSPVKFKDDLLWKGIYIQDFDLTLGTSLDGKGQFDVVRSLTRKINQSATHETDAWITSSGLNLKVDLSFGDSTGMVFQTFPSHLDRFRFEMDENQVVADNSYIKGDFIIPVISNEKSFSFAVPINNLGFQDGYPEDLVDTRFVFNAGAGDQEIKVTIKRAVLSGYEKVALTLDLEWPGLGITLADLRGFNAWGDYFIGFDNKNGTVPLTDRYNASLSGYPITIGVIGAGSNDGNYVFATTADAGLGDDVSGGTGVPSINVYSVSANKYVPKSASGRIVAEASDQIPFDQASNNVSKDYSQVGNDLAKRVEADQEKIVAEAESIKNGLVSGSNQIFPPEEMIPSDGKQFPSEIGFGEQPKDDGKFNSRQQQVIQDIATGLVEELAKALIDPIKKKTDSLSLIIEKSINKLVDKTGGVITSNVTAIVKGLTDNLIKTLSNDKVDIETPLRQMEQATINILSQEIISSLQQATKNTIIEPVNVLLKDQVTGRINKHITVNGAQMVYSALTGEGGDAEKALDQLIEGVPAVMEAIVKDVAAFVSVEHVESTIEATATGFVKGINVSEIGHDLRKAAEDILKDELNKAATKAITGLTEKYAGDIGLGSLGGGGENPINFVGVAERFSKGGIEGVFAVDPVRVKLKTPIIDLDGFMSYTPKHPVYGDVWLGDIDMTIKKPKKFAFNAIYFNGRKEDVSYWFCQITPPGDSNEPYQLGKPLSKAVKPLKDPADIGIAKIVGASGRLYHHMSETSTGGIVPDAAMSYGAYMHFVLFDKNSGGKNMRLEVAGEIDSKENGDYTIEFDGNLQLQSMNPQVMELDKRAVVQGTVIIRYNSAEEHFFGYAKVVVNSKALCAQASLLVDVKPGKWRVAIGSREERIIFVPGCAGWSPTGWLDLSESTAELGLGVQYSGRADQGLDLSFVDVHILVDAGFAFGVVAEVQYRPDFELIEAGVWVDIWADVIVSYKFLLHETHTITLAEIYIRGDLVMVFKPSPATLEGSLNGHVKVLFFDVNFKAHMKKQLT